MIEANPEKEGICPPGFLWVGDSLINIDHIVHIEPLPINTEHATLCLVNGDTIVCTKSSVVDFAKAIRWSAARRAPSGEQIPERSDLDLLGWAVAHVGNWEHDARPRWSHVAALFGLGSTSAIQLCRRFAVDVDEIPQPRPHPHDDDDED